MLGIFQECKRETSSTSALQDPAGLDRGEAILTAGARKQQSGEATEAGLQIRRPPSASRPRISGAMGRCRSRERLVLPEGRRPADPDPRPDLRPSRHRTPQLRTGDIMNRI